MVSSSKRKPPRFHSESRLGKRSIDPVQSKVASGEHPVLSPPVGVNDLDIVRPEPSMNEVRDAPPPPTSTGKKHQRRPSFSFCLTKSAPDASTVASNSTPVEYSASLLNKSQQIESKAEHRAHRRGSKVVTSSDEAMNEVVECLDQIRIEEESCDGHEKRADVVSSQMGSRRDDSSQQSQSSKKRMSSIFSRLKKSEEELEKKDALPPLQQKDRLKLFSRLRASNRGNGLLMKGRKGSNVFRDGAASTRTGLTNSTIDVSETLDIMSMPFIPHNHECRVEVLITEPTSQANGQRQVVRDAVHLLEERKAKDTDLSNDKDALSITSSIPSIDCNWDGVSVVPQVLSELPKTAVIMPFRTTVDGKIEDVGSQDMISNEEKYGPDMKKEVDDMEGAIDGVIKEQHQAGEEHVTDLPVYQPLEDCEESDVINKQENSLKIREQTSVPEVKAQETRPILGNVSTKYETGAPFDLNSLVDEDKTTKKRIPSDQQACGITVDQWDVSKVMEGTEAASSVASKERDIEPNEIQDINESSDKTSKALSSECKILQNEQLRNVSGIEGDAASQASTKQPYSVSSLENEGRNVGYEVKLSTVGKQTDRIASTLSMTERISLIERNIAEKKKRTDFSPNLDASGPEESLQPLEQTTASMKPSMMQEEKRQERECYGQPTEDKQRLKRVSRCSKPSRSHRNRGSFDSKKTRSRRTHDEKKIKTKRTSDTGSPKKSKSFQSTKKKTREGKMVPSGYRPHHKQKSSKSALSFGQVGAIVDMFAEGTMQSIDPFLDSVLCGQIGLSDARLDPELKPALYNQSSNVL